MKQEYELDLIKRDRACFYGNYENGLSIPCLSTAIKLCVVFIKLYDQIYWWKLSNLSCRPF